MLVENNKRHWRFLQSLHLAGWSWRLKLEWCERKILLGWLELVAGVL